MAFIGKLLTFQKIENSSCGGGSRLHIGHTLRDLSQRRSEQAHIQDEGNDHTKINGTVDRQDRTHHADGNITDIADHIHQRLHHTGKKLRFPVGIIHSLIQLIKTL